MNEDFKFAFRQRTTWVWLFLVAATCFSWVMGSRASTIDSENAGILMTVLIVVALVKVRFVIRYFMEVREAALGLRVLTDLWCVVVGLAILVLSWGLFGNTG